MPWRKYAYGWIDFRVKTKLPSPSAKAQRFCNIQQLAELTGVPVRTLRSMWHKRQISAVKTGHRTMLFRPELVIAEIEKFTVKAVA